MIVSTKTRLTTDAGQIGEVTDINAAETSEDTTAAVFVERATDVIPRDLSTPAAHSPDNNEPASDPLERFYTQQETVKLESDLLPGKRFSTHREIRNAIRLEAMTRACMIACGFCKSYSSERALRVNAESDAKSFLKFVDMGLVGQPDVPALLKYYEQNKGSIMPYQVRTRRRKEEQLPIEERPADDDAAPTAAVKKAPARRPAKKVTAAK